MDQSINLQTLIAIARRRFWFLAVPLIVAAFAAVLLLGVLPPIYRSEAVIRIEEQNIPEDLVPALINDYIEQQLDTLGRRILTQDNLLQIINRHDLYQDQAAQLRSSEVTAMLRDNIIIGVIKTEVSNPQTGRTGEIPVAFRIRFDYANPTKARAVVSDLVSQYLSTHAESRRAVAAQTANFFGNERQAVEQRIAAAEERLAEFKTENRELLPEETAFQRQMLNNVESQLQLIDRDLRSLKERQSFLTTQVALTPEFDAPTIRGGTAATPEAQLELLRAELATARARYSATHPDVIRLEREVRSLGAVVGARSTVGQLADREAALVAELARLRERYTEDHPDVVRARGALASIRDDLEAIERESSAGSVGGGTRNTAYVQLSAQLNSVESEIRSIEQQRSSLENERVNLQKLLAQAPRVEQQYIRLQRDLEAAIAEREELADMQATAELSTAAETQAVAERLVLAEPANLPTDPVRPRKKLILALGLVLGMCGGGAAAALGELTDRSVRSSRDLKAIIGDTPLVSIPTLRTANDRWRIWAFRFAGIGALGVVCIAALVAVDRVIMPLDVLVYDARAWVTRWLAIGAPGAGVGL
mgnify:CR=1 FL=1